MKRFLILSAFFLLLAGVAQAQVGQNDTLNKGVSRTGGVYNGCDCDNGQEFATRRGNDTLYPRVTRTGKLLQVTATIASCKIPGCGITDQEALVDVKLKWTGNYISRVSSCGLKYCIQGTQDSIKVNYPVSICGDTTIRLELQPLSPNTSYHVRAFVVLLSTEDTVWSNIVPLTTKKHHKCGGWIPNENESQTDLDSFDLVKDHENNFYGVVQIGNRCWMRENMRATTSPSLNLKKKENPNVDDNILNNDPTTSLNSRVAHWYHNNEANKEDFGALYNWCAAVDTSHVGTDPWSCVLLPNHRGICPVGWHLPTNEEWTEMEKTLNNNNVLTNATDTLAGLLAGGCNWKEDGNANHKSPGNYQYAGWGKSGFDALPSGCFANNGSSISMSDSSFKAYFWTSSEDLQDTKKAYQRNFSYNTQEMKRNAESKDYGMSVRCVRDIPDFAIYWKKNDDCTYQVYSTLPGIPHGSLSYTWRINDDVFNTGTDSILTFTLKEETDNYHIVCEATRPGDIFQASTDIVLTDWPPILTVLCSDSFATAINVSSNDHVASASWFNSNNELISDVTSGYVPLEPGKNSVRLTNSTGACRPDTVKVAQTTCWVYDSDNTNGNHLKEISSMKDANGNRYPVVQIGNRCWMRVNMRSENDFSFGNTNGNINATGGSTDNSTPLYYNYSSQNAMPLEQRGYLYNQNAANKVCPAGWHLPSLQEWRDLVSAVMGTDHKTCLLAGGCDWNASNTANAAGNSQAYNRNASGLTIVPAGNMESSGIFTNWGKSARFWTSTDKDNKTNRVAFNNNENVMSESYVERNVAYSVRCVRDLTLNVCVLMDTVNDVPNTPVLVEILKIGDNTYNVVQIGDRCWTKENMRETKNINKGQDDGYHDGYYIKEISPIDPYYYDFNPYDFSSTNHTNNSYYGNNNENNVNIPLEERGYLYNWPAAMLVCPEGWHLPSLDEWIVVTNHADWNRKASMLSVCQYWKSSSSGTPGYCQSHCDVCNSLGFSLVPTGNSKDYKFDYGGRSVSFWTTTPYASDNTKIYRKVFDYNKINAPDDSWNNLKSRGFNVRCIRDL